MRFEAVFVPFDGSSHCSTGLVQVDRRLATRKPLRSAVRSTGTRPVGAINAAILS
jgi:hypothetical protein